MNHLRKSMLIVIAMLILQLYMVSKLQMIRIVPNHVPDMLLVVTPMLLKQDPPTPLFKQSIMTKHADFCWNQDECNIFTPNHHEIRLIRGAETLAKQTNKTNALQQSAQIWSAAKDELICRSLCEKTLTTWTPLQWKCSYEC